MAFRLVAVLLIGLIAPSAGHSSGEVSDGIRGFLEGLDAGASPDIAGRRLNHPELLAAVYLGRDHAPIWLKGAPLQNARGEMLTAIGASVAHGFNAERYHRSPIERLMPADDESSAVALELLLTDAFLTQALHRGRGIVGPPNLDAEWQVPVAEVDAVALLLDVADRHRGVVRQLDALWPADEEYSRLLRRRAEISASGEELAIRIAPGPLLKPGQSSDRVRMLKQRLLGPGDYTPDYDDALRREVEAFQFAAGLEPDGIVGEHTLEVLNAGKVDWVERIDANLERWRWLPRQTPDVYIRVNIAAFTLHVMDHGRVPLSMDVIVGRQYRQTPVFAEPIRYLVLNPYWNVPYSIATKDKLPLLKADAVTEAAKGFEVRLPGSDTFVAVDSVDWADVTSRNFNYLLRQKPGSHNALGKIKFMMPNRFSVYLHDTPSRELFARQERSFSSGCIRLEKPMELADWILARDRHPEKDRIREIAAAGKPHTVHLREPVPVYVVYFTAFAMGDDDVSFRRDVYERDRVLIAALRAEQAP
jgi:murein L,D-transpeptidase YcbB/YkuD